MLRRRAESISTVSSSGERRGGDKGTGGDDGGGALYAADETCLRGIDRVRIWFVVIA